MRTSLVLLLIALVLTAACTTTPTPTATPAPSLTPSLTYTPSATRTPPPTATSIPTLPPTWTPAITATALLPTALPTATFTPTIDPNPTLLAQPTRAECANFGIDLTLSRPDFVIGTDPQVFWRPAVGALTYRLILRDDEDNLLFAITTGGTSYTFDGRLFQLNRNYTWDVRPLDVSGAQMCVSRGSVLTPVIG